MVFRLLIGLAASTVALGATVHTISSQRVVTSYGAVQGTTSGLNDAVTVFTEYTIRHASNRRTEMDGANSAILMARHS
jgi:hypothetical protein